MCFYKTSMLKDPSTNSLVIDVGYGTVAPSPPSNDLVFSYLYILPYYLKAVLMLTAVGTSLYADFGKTAQRYQDAINQFANFLTTIHDLIAGSITKLLPGPPPWQVSLEGDFTRGIQGGFSERFIKGGNSTDPGKYEMFLSSINVIAGAVEPFSGFSSIKDWEIKVGSAPGLPPYSNSFDPGGFQSACESTFKKIQVRVLREAMNVYSGVSLLKVWTAINSLKSLAGAAPLPRHKYARWSFREIFSAAGMGARSDGLFHLSDMAGLIWNTSPLDSQESSHSWRNLLEP